MNDVAIRAESVGKMYRIYDKPEDRLKHGLLRAWGVQYGREFWALHDISFEVKKGESVGIIGRNGSGKSTLLEIIAGTLQPTLGNVSVNGQVAALLELGSGFNPEYTGRENVYMNGAILGLARGEIDAHFDEIASFADIGGFLDQAVKTYSSGMLVRLAFAIQTAVHPDIMIIDEALSVGDYFFQQKCFTRLRELREKGLTLLFVSHDLGMVRDLCAKALYLRKGHAEYFGDSKSAIQSYLAERSETGVPEAPPAPPASAKGTGGQDESLVQFKKTALWSIPDDQEKGRRLLAVRVLDAAGHPATQARIGETVRIQVAFRTAPDEYGHIGFILKNRFDHVVTSNGTYPKGMPARSSGDRPFALVEFEVDLMVEAGLYSLTIGFSQPTLPNQGDLIESTDRIGPLQVKWDYESDRAPFLGMFGLPCAIREPGHSHLEAPLRAADIVSRSILNGKNRSGAGGMEILAACVTDRNGNPTLSVPMTQELRFHIYARALRTVKRPYFGIVIHDRNANLIFTGTTAQVMGYCPEMAAGQEITIGFKVRMTVQAGEYLFRLSCAEPTEPYHPNKGVSLDAYEQLGPITVQFDYERERAPFYGIAQLPMEML